MCIRDRSCTVYLVRAENCSSLAIDISPGGVAVTSVPRRIVEIPQYFVLEGFNDIFM